MDRVYISVRFLANVEDIKNLRLVPYTTIHIDNFYQKLNFVRAVVVKRKAILIVVFSHKIPPYLLSSEMAEKKTRLLLLLSDSSDSHLLRDSKHWN